MTLPREPHEGIKADAGPENAAAEADQSSYVARASGSRTAARPTPVPQRPMSSHPRLFPAEPLAAMRWPG